MIELVGTLAAAAVTGLVWMAWAHPSVFERYLSFSVLLSPWIAFIAAGCFILGYDLRGTAPIDWYIGPSLRQAEFIGFLLLICLIACIALIAQRISPHRARRVRKNSAKQ